MGERDSRDRSRGGRPFAGHCRPASDRGGAPWTAVAAAMALLTWGGEARPAKAEPPATCELERGPARTAVRVADGDSVSLDDGSEIRLAGIRTPRALDTIADAAVWPPQTEAVAALASLVLGQRIELAFTPKPRGDRYGRLSAHVFVERDGRRIWVQGHLLEQGHARVSGLFDGFACVDELMAHEQPARIARRGMWSHPAYHDRAAYRTRELMRLRGTLQLVTGRVRKVAEVRNMVLLNFGADWHDDFSVGFKVDRRVPGAQDLAAWMRALEGRRVRVRGWIDRRNGPFIEIAHRSEIEVLDDAVAGNSQPAARGESSGRSAGP